MTVATDRQALGPGGLHGSAVAFGDRAVLIRGRSGSGKSALALALLQRRLFDGTPAQLLADDRVCLRAEGGVVTAFAPERLHGLIEARGVGLLRLRAAGPCPLALVIDLVDRDAFTERLPGRSRLTLAGASLPLVRLIERSSAANADIVAALLSGAEILDPDAG